MTIVNLDLEARIARAIQDHIGQMGLRVTVDVDPGRKEQCELVCWPTLNPEGLGRLGSLLIAISSDMLDDGEHDDGSAHTPAVDLWIRSLSEPLQGGELIDSVILEGDGTDFELQGALCLSQTVRAIDLDNAMEIFAERGLGFEVDSVNGHRYLGRCSHCGGHMTAADPYVRKLKGPGPWRAGELPDLDVYHPECWAEVSDSEGWPKVKS